METRRQQMMGELNGVMEQLRAATERLDALVETMDGSQGEAKADATAAVVAELVAQRKAFVDLIERELGMMQQMHTMHMMMGGAPGGSGADQP